MIFHMYFLMKRILFALFGRKNQLVVKTATQTTCHEAVTRKPDTAYEVQITALAEVRV